MHEELTVGQDIYFLSLVGKDGNVIPYENYFNNTCNLKHIFIEKGRISRTERKRLRGEMCYLSYAVIPNKFTEKLKNKDLELVHVRKISNESSYLSISGLWTPTDINKRYVNKHPEMSNEVFFKELLKDYIKQGIGTQYLELSLGLNLLKGVMDTLDKDSDLYSKISHSINSIKTSIYNKYTTIQLETTEYRNKEYFTLVKKVEVEEPVEEEETEESEMSLDELLEEIEKEEE